MNEHTIPIGNRLVSIAALCARNTLPHGVTEHDPQIAAAFGNFYGQLLATYTRTDISGVEKHQLLDDATAGLPEQLQAVYGGVAGIIDDQLASNHALLGMGDNTSASEKIAQLLQKSVVMHDEGGTLLAEEARTEVLSELSYEDMELREPSKGLFIIEMGESAQRELTSMGMITEGTRAQYVNRSTQSPGYILLPKTYPHADTTKELIEDHEEHHFIRHQLALAGLIAKSTEPDQANADAFEKFANEVGGYTLSHRGLTAIQTRDMLPRVDDDAVLRQANQSHRIVGLAMELVKSEDAPVDPFQEAALHARSFAEIEANASALVPRDLSVRSLKTIFDLWYTDKVDGTVVASVLGVPAERFSFDACHDYAEQKLVDAKEPSQFLQDLQELHDFFAVLQISLPFTETDIVGRLHEQVALPDATLKLLPTLYRKYAYFRFDIAPFLSTESMEQFLKRRIRDYDLTREVVVEIWQQLVVSSPELTRAYQIVKPQLIVKLQTELAEHLAHAHPEAAQYYQQRATEQLAGLNAIG